MYGQRLRSYLELFLCELAPIEGDTEQFHILPVENQDIRIIADQLRITPHLQYRGNQRMVFLQIDMQISCLNQKWRERVILQINRLGQCCFHGKPVRSVVLNVVPKLVWKMVLKVVSKIVPEF